MSATTELIHESHEAVRQMLHLQLADEYAFYKITWDYVLHVSGPDFFSLRLQFQLQHNDATRWVDDLSEWIGDLRLDGRISREELLDVTRCSAAPGLGLPAEQMLVELLRLHDGIMARLCVDSVECLRRFGDAPTAGFLLGLREQHENASWMLRAQLETAA